MWGSNFYGSDVNIYIVYISYNYICISTYFDMTGLDYTVGCIINRLNFFISDKVLNHLLFKNILLRYSYWMPLSSGTKCVVDFFCIWKCKFWDNFGESFSNNSIFFRYSYWMPLRHKMRCWFFLQRKCKFWDSFADNFRNNFWDNFRDNFWKNFRNNFGKQNLWTIVWSISGIILGTISRTILGWFRKQFQEQRLGQFWGQFF